MFIITRYIYALYTLMLKEIGIDLHKNKAAVLQN